MNDPTESRLAARLLNNPPISQIEIAERKKIANAFDKADTFRDLPKDIAEIVSDALTTYEPPEGL